MTTAHKSIRQQPLQADAIPGVVTELIAMEMSGYARGLETAAETLRAIAHQRDGLTLEQANNLARTLTDTAANAQRSADLLTTSE